MLRPEVIQVSAGSLPESVDGESASSVHAGMTLGRHAPPPSRPAGTAPIARGETDLVTYSMLSAPCLSSPFPYRRFPGMASQNKPFASDTFSVCSWGTHAESRAQVVLTAGGFLGISDGKASARNAGDLSSILGLLGRSPGEGNGNPLQYSCLENPMHGGAP